MPFRIKVRLAELGRKQVELIPALEKRQIKTNPSELSNTLKGVLQSPKAEKILSAANEIVTEWEQEHRKTS
ncbi:MAG: hypothetical protein MRZ61_00060 [Oscillospiraceae bacterium]|nr:hypothetical protein [Oscillospiraceae bacterium]